ncbi:MAG: ABC transporter ATP-binding protein [Acetatifactor sp.]|nr:ABC transporter ATP-binding protein [Acetatifactor sp.]
MIEMKHVKKQFDEVTALSDITANIEEGHVFGLIGTNGAGKSTLLRSISGIFQPEQGEILIDGEPVYDNPSAKSKLFFISDDQFFFAGSTPQDMLSYYETMYPNFDRERFYTLLDVLKLDKKRKINTFSKGMKKQLSVLYGVCAGTKYLLCDETFDGLDPVIRQAVKRLFIQEMEQRNMTPIIASHNLRELEDICEHIGLLHQGGILFSRDLDEMKLGIYKVQYVLNNADDFAKLSSRLEVLQKEARGSLSTLTIRATHEEIADVMAELQPVFWEILPLTLEEIFISETEVLGYDFKHLTL